MAQNHPQKKKKAFRPSTNERKKKDYTQATTTLFNKKPTLIIDLRGRKDNDPNKKARLCHPLRRLWVSLRTKHLKRGGQWVPISAGEQDVKPRVKQRKKG